MAVPEDRTFGPESKLVDVLRDPRGRKLLEQAVPELLSSPLLHTFLDFPVSLVLKTEPALIGDPQSRLEFEAALAQIEPRGEVSVADRGEAGSEPQNDYEAAGVKLGSAHTAFSESVSLYGRLEVDMIGPMHGNPFVDVYLRAQITGPSGSVDVPGFYRGDGRYTIRFMPPQPGAYSFVTMSNARSLTGVSGSFRVGPALPQAHGPVVVADRFHFAYADGTRFVPVGTTAYAWTHQPEALEEKTLRSLAASSFNKIRMCVFPKSYLFNENEPPRYPFEGTPEGGFDFSKPHNPYWDHLEMRIEQLASIGVEADLILFHAYDRWGFSEMGEEADDRYVAYAVARLSAFSNVWWSLANEFDLLFGKTDADWERMAALVVRDDPTGHLRSIHNCHRFYENSRPWITHSSMQRTDRYKTAEMVTEWREAWGKPVVVDECAYEGNIDQGWGNISGQEMTRRFWEGAMRGGYVGHGETYVDADDVLWWSKGGTLHGTSPDRIAFLREILEDAPTSLEPSPLEWDALRIGVEHEYLLYYFGFNQPTYRRFLLDPATSYTVDVIDTWGMTVKRLEGTYAGRFTIPLPGRQYMAVRLEAARP